MRRESSVGRLKTCVLFTKYYNLLQATRDVVVRKNSFVLFLVVYFVIKSRDSDESLWELRRKHFKVDNRPAQ